MISFSVLQRPARVLVFAWIACAGVSTVSAQLSRTPAVGSAERKAILDVIRKTCERDLQQKVIFKVTLLNVAGEWAAARVVPLRPDGGNIDFTNTKYKDLDAEGAFDGEGEVLLRRKDGDWSVVKWRFGASDTELSLWIEELGAPKSLEHSE